MSEVNCLLKDARDLIREKGWVKYQYGNMDLGFCVVGAIIRAKQNRGPHVFVRSDNNSVGEAIGFLSSIVDESVSKWNDKPGQTQEAVLELFDLAIEATSKAT